MYPISKANEPQGFTNTLFYPPAVNRCLRVPAFEPLAPGLFCCDPVDNNVAMMSNRVWRTRCFGTKLTSSKSIETLPKGLQAVSKGVMEVDQQNSFRWKTAHEHEINGVCKRSELVLECVNSLTQVWSISFQVPSTTPSWSRSTGRGSVFCRAELLLWTLWP